VFEAKILITELSFVRPNHRRDKIHKFGHMHLDDFLERADRFQNELVICGHLSTRYHPQEVRRVVEARLPVSLRDRVKLWILSRQAQVRAGHFPGGRTGAFTTTNRFGCLPTLTRATSRRRTVSRIDTSSPRTLLTQQSLPSGLNVTQFGPRPTPTLSTIFWL